MEHFVCYLKKFYRVKGLIGLVSGVFPFVAHGCGWDGSRVIPPLDNDLLGIYVILLMMVILVGYSLRYSAFFEKIHGVATVMVIGCVVGACIVGLAYVKWQEKAIRCGEVKPVDKSPVTICVIIGLERSELGKTKYAEKTPEEMLRKRGWTREQVRCLWTPQSIEKARRNVIGSYLAILLLLVGIVGILLVRECIEEKWGEDKSSK